MSASLTPAGCDVRSLPFMPLEPRRLLDSDLFLLSTGAEFKAAVALWCWSWTQVPAASIPDDERVHAKVAGVSLVEWRELADMALRGWIACEDGRLYHPVVAEKALRAWVERLKLKERSAKGNAARHDRFTYSPEQHAARMAEAVAHLERLAPGAAIEFGIVLEGGSALPCGSDTAPCGSPAGSDLGSELNVTEHNETEGNGLTLVDPPSGPTPEEQAFADFVCLADDLGLAKPRKLDDDRARKLALRLTENGGLEGWSSILDLIRQSPFLYGRGDRGWKVTLDWLLNPTNLRKVVEGGYVQEDATPSPGNGGYMALAMEGFR